MDYSSINFFKFLIPEYRNQYKSHVLPNITPGLSSNEPHKKLENFFYEWHYMKKTVWCFSTINSNNDILWNMTLTHV